MIKNMNSKMVMDFLVREKLRIIVITATVLGAWLLASLLTPYYTRPQVQFVDADARGPVYMRAEVIEINDKKATVRVLEGAQKGQELPAQIYSGGMHIGSTVLISEDATIDGANPVSMVWRLPVVIGLIAVMIILIVLIGGRQGLLSLVGLGTSIGVIAYYIVPSVLAGGNALLISSLGAFVVATVTVMVGHRLRWRTIISLLGIYIILAVVIMLATVSGWLASLTGVYDETSSILNMGGQTRIDMYGVLLGGIIIASLGVLDDVVTTQVAAVDELKRAKPHMTRKELFVRGMSVGREHLSALVNTLALAYVGVALPTILIMAPAVASSTQLLLYLNQEILSVEIIRTAIASIGIILAIPICTGLAVLLVDKKQSVLAWLDKRASRSRRSS